MNERLADRNVPASRHFTRWRGGRHDLQGFRFQLCSRDGPDEKRLAELIEADEPSTLREIAALLGQNECALPPNVEPPKRLSLMARIRTMLKR
jgi:hypothetical protein